VTEASGRPADEPVGPSTDMPPAVENALRAPRLTRPRIVERWGPFAMC
jgi:hypothetical protein